MKTTITFFPDAFEPTVATFIDSRIADAVVAGLNKLPKAKQVPFSFKKEPDLVTRRNLMTGEEYQEDRETPLYLSPASETYWSA